MHETENTTGAHTGDMPRVVSDIIDVSDADWQALRDGEHGEPHRILGVHPVRHEGVLGVVVRAYHPEAVSADCIFPSHDSSPLRLIRTGGLFAAFFSDKGIPFAYHVRFHFADGNAWERDEPYRFLPTMGDMDLHLFNEGRHLRAWTCFGAHCRRVEGVDGVSFAVWAPNAVRVSVVGDFCRWDGRLFPMRRMGSSGLFELFIPGFESGGLYKYEIKTKDGAIRLKADPYGQSMEGPPGNATRVYQSHYEWNDASWMSTLPERDYRREPMAVYEVHLGSWARVPEEGNRLLTYRELAPRLAEHAKRLGFTHIELLPVAEHPLGASWGYQVTGYYAPTWRHGDPDDFRYFVDVCHQQGIGVILDWVPAHFPKDDFALRRFDGTALYEHDDPRQGEHPDWGTLVFNYGRREVRTFLLANALYWLKEFHIDGLRIDAVASMLYLDYSRSEGDWIPNAYGGKENIEALEFLRELNETIRAECPGRMTIAEESTAWGGVTKPTALHGLGFTFKWNMGWMHDTLSFFQKDPIYRRYHQQDLTFAMLYESTEAFVNAISHDEVVHGKRSLLEKMPGDIWQQFANLRTLLTYQYTRPGKKHLFMGAELAPHDEWNYDASLDWHLAHDPMRIGLRRFIEALGALYLDTECLWRCDPDPHGFEWIECNDCENSVLSYLRRHDQQERIVVLNLTPTPRDEYCIGVSTPGWYECTLCSDETHYSGSGYAMMQRVHTDERGAHGRSHSLLLRLPPLCAVVYAPIP